MAITSAICNSFKVEILQGGHNFNDSSGAPTGNATSTQTGGGFQCTIGPLNDRA